MSQVEQVCIFLELSIIQVSMKLRKRCLHLGSRRLYEEGNRSWKDNNPTQTSNQPQFSKKGKTDNLGLRKEPLSTRRQQTY
ncbi:hypothetical protein PRUPE_3G160900 [Prunus persica]|uniref:Uncharacterized protein n=1 Tax=Prunus persica TaxID=3760 RepID=A0A251Q0U7_PRUPE|nr:hypothetical protein PRUPE_3G160900 [Prunus persica]